MRQTRLALVASGIWAAAAMAAGVLLFAFGFRPLIIVDAAVLLALAAGGTVLLGRRAEWKTRAEIAALSLAVGVAPADEAAGTPTLERVIGALVARLERLSPLKPAFGLLQAPALLVTEAGEILAATGGGAEILPAAIEGTNIDALLGTMPSPEKPEGGTSLVKIGGQRYVCIRSPIGAGRVLLELRLAGQSIADDDLDAFAEALASGRTAFHFDPEAVAKSPLLAALNDALHMLDATGVAMAALTAGEDVDPAFLAGNAGLSPTFRALHDAVWAVVAERDEEAAAREFLEGKLGAVARAIDSYRSAAGRMGELAASTRSGLVIATEALGRVRDGTRNALKTEQKAGAIAGGAAMVAGRTREAIGGVDGSVEALDKLAAAIEDVSIRTNMLALNAAVEAARAGEKGAGFAVVAEEVRTLAQSSQQTAKEIRALVAQGRTQSAGGMAHAEALQKILADLEAHLRNLSNDTEIIAGAVEEGGRAVSRATTDLNAVDGEVQRTLTLPQRTARAA